MSEKTGIWEYDPESDRVAWHFPGGVSFDALTRQERDRVLECLRAARDMEGLGVVAEVLRIGGQGENAGLWIALYGRRVLKAWTSVKIVGVVVDVTEQQQAMARHAAAGGLESCVEPSWTAGPLAARAR